MTDNNRDYTFMCNHIIRNPHLTLDLKTSSVEDWYKTLTWSIKLSNERGLRSGPISLEQYPFTNSKGRRTQGGLLLSNLVYILHYGKRDSDNYSLSYVDGNYDNYDISNLHLITAKQRALKRGKTEKEAIKSGSKHKGVKYCKRKGLWLSSARLATKHPLKPLYFKNEEDAAARYNDYVREDLPGILILEHDLTGNVPLRFIPYLNEV